MTARSGWHMSPWARTFFCVDLWAFSPGPTSCFASHHEMLYRKSSPNPPTLLLRIVASAGASAILGTAACSGTDPVMGSVASIPDSGHEQPNVGQGGQPPGSADSGTPGTGPCGGGPCGTVAMPPAGDASVAPCNGGPCGTVVMPPADDAGKGPCNGGPCGTVVMPPADDAGKLGGGGGPDDAGKGPCNGGPCGTVVMPPADDAGLADSGKHFPIGVVIGVTPFPDDAGRPCHPCGVVIRPDGG